MMKPWQRFFHPTRRDLLAYLDGELSPQARQQISRHCAACPHCEALLAGEQRVKQDLQATLPALGKRRSDDLSRLLPAILGESRKAPAAFNQLAVVIAFLLLIVTLLPMLPAFDAGISAPQNDLHNIPIATSTLSPLQIPQAGTPVHVADALWVGKALQNAPYLQYASPAPLPQATMEASFVPGK